MLERMISAALACCCTAALISCIPAVQEAASTSAPSAAERAVEGEPGTPVKNAQEIEGR